jgi:hypothetical protein
MLDIRQRAEQFPFRPPVRRDPIRQCYDDRVRVSIPYHEEINLNDELHNTLRAHLASDWQANPAMKTLINDYATYHLALVLAGGFLVLLLALSSVVFWLRFKKIPKTGRCKWPFEKKAYFSFGLLSSIFGLLFALIVAANATNAFNPVPGFSLLAGSSSTSSNSAAGRALNEWIQSGNGNVPPVLEQKVQERIAWQKPKAIICGILLVVSAVLSLRLWNALIEATRASETKWRRNEYTLFVAGIATVAFSLLMTVMVVANMQAAIAPITITLLGVGN